MPIDGAAEARAGDAAGDARARFFASLRDALDRRTFVRLVLAKPQVAQADAALRVTVRALEWRGARGLSFVHRHATRDVTRNHSLEDGLAQVEGLVGTAFAHAHLRAADEDMELRINRKGHGGLVRKTITVAPVSEVALPAASDELAPHDRVKHRFLDSRRPWLAALGVTDAEGRIVPAMARKWKQINRFVEVFDHAFTASALASRDAVRVVDFGSGKGYLTFAIHDHLRRTMQIAADVTGVELRAHLVALCNAAAAASALEGLVFVEGDVRTYTTGPIDVMIALHACDTATDHALHFGLRAGASIILCSPCCHKQLRPQMRSPDLLLPLLRHGIHLGQQAEMVTDGLRALLLEAAGYATQVFEFVALEHTSKNKMILAVRRERPLDAAAHAALIEQIAALKSFYGIREQCLETLLEADAAG